MAKSAEEVIRAFLAQFANPKLEEVLACFSADAIYQDARPGALHRGAEALREEFQAQLRAVPTTNFTIKTLVSDGHVVMVEREEQFNFNGKPLYMEGVIVFEVNAAGQITRMRDYYDRGQFAG